MARRRSIYREPTVTLGEPKPMPEKRQDVIDRMLSRLAEQGPFLMQFSNGEFVSSSIALARTFEECAKVRVLEAPGYTVHHDEKLGVFWRRGGSFD